MSMSSNPSHLPPIYCQPLKVWHTFDASTQFKLLSRSLTQFKNFVWVPYQTPFQLVFILQRIIENIAFSRKKDKVYTLQQQTYALWQQTYILWPQTQKCTFLQQLRAQLSYKLDNSTENIRSRHRWCSIKKHVLKTIAKSTGKHLCWSFFFSKVAGVRSRPATLLKKETPTRVFF